MGACWLLSWPIAQCTSLRCCQAVGGRCAFCELQSEMMLDESAKLYSYQSPAGVLALIMKVFVFCWFAYHVKLTHEGESDERAKRYYKFLGISFTGWSLNVPVTVVVAFSLNPWVRYKVVTMVDISFRFLGLMILSRLLCGPLSPITHDNTFHVSDSMLAQFTMKASEANDF